MGAPGSKPHAGLLSLPAQALTVFQRSLTAMQIQVAGLLQFAAPRFPAAEVRRPALPSAPAGEGKRVPSLCSLAPSCGLKGLSPEAAVCGFIHKPSPPRSLCLLGLSACPPLPASERSAWNPAPAELVRVQPPPADRLVGLPGAAQGAGWPWGAGGGEGAPQQATSSQGEASRGWESDCLTRGAGWKSAWLLDSLQ